MLDQTKMNTFKENGGAAALKLRGELVTALQDRIGGTLRAVNEYFASRRKSETAISERVKELEAQREELEAEVAAMGPDLAAATISGDVNTLEQIQDKLTDLEARKAATSAQVELLNGVSVSGDEGLFHEADRQARELDRFWSETMTDLSALASFANEQANLWRQVASISDLGGNIMPKRTISDRVAEMRRDFQEVK